MVLSASPGLFTKLTPVLRVTTALVPNSSPCLAPSVPTKMTVFRRIRYLHASPSLLAITTTNRLRT